MIANSVLFATINSEILFFWLVFIYIYISFIMNES